MDRPYLVYVGGCAEQPIECLYLGTEGDLAQSIFEDAGNDGANEIVRFCTFPEHSQIRTPKRDGVPVRETSPPEGGEGEKDSTAGAPPVIVPAPTTTGTVQAPGAGAAPQTSAVAAPGPKKGAGVTPKPPGSTTAPAAAATGPEEAFDAP